MLRIQTDPRHNESDPCLEAQLEMVTWSTETETDGQNRKEPGGNLSNERGGINSRQR